MGSDIRELFALKHRGCLAGPNCRLYGVEFLGSSGKLGPTATVSAMPNLTDSETPSLARCMSWNSLVIEASNLDMQPQLQ